MVGLATALPDPTHKKLLKYHVLPSVYPAYPSHRYYDFQAYPHHSYEPSLLFHKSFVHY
ncbi:hypothetical protein O3P69_015275 [Scylla paramamosain]|uniref:FAS1 domain-containing protein n=1 Tax=Scylla paramamosain TaxID=85552 RepID=A0AAW0T4B0_SCYPA